MENLIGEDSESYQLVGLVCLRLGSEYNRTLLVMLEPLYPPTLSKTVEHENNGKPTKHKIHCVNHARKLTLVLPF